MSDISKADFDRLAAIVNELVGLNNISRPVRVVEQFRPTVPEPAKPTVAPDALSKIDPEDREELLNVVIAANALFDAGVMSAKDAHKLLFDYWEKHQRKYGWRIMAGRICSDDISAFKDFGDYLTRVAKEGK